MKNIIVLFPGMRGDEIPLLYFAGKKYRDLGYEVVFMDPKRQMEKDLSVEQHIDIMYEYWKLRLNELKIKEYDNIIFAAKSMGTVCACRMKEELKLNARLILFTPLYQTLKYIHDGNQIQLVAAGTLDTWLPSETLKEHCKKANVPYYIEPGVGHRMEVNDNLKRNLEVIYNVLTRC